jgi:hypothetical protein
MMPFGSEDISSLAGDSWTCGIVFYLCRNSNLLQLNCDVLKLQQALVELQLTLVELQLALVELQLVLVEFQLNFVEVQQVQYILLQAQSNSRDPQSSVNSLVSVKLQLTLSSLRLVSAKPLPNEYSSF